MNKHTPGPLRACGETRGGCQCKMVWSTSADIPVAAALSAEDETYTCGHDCDQETAIANARLIAAAPDLLAALESLASIVNEETTKFPANRVVPAGVAYAAAVAAIARARGEA